MSAGNFQGGTTPLLSGYIGPPNWYSWDETGYWAAYQDWADFGVGTPDASDPRWAILAHPELASGQNGVDQRDYDPPSDPSSYPTDGGAPIGSWIVIPDGAGRPDINVGPYISWPFSRTVKLLMKSGAEIVLDASEYQIPGIATDWTDISIRVTANTLPWLYQTGLVSPEDYNAAVREVGNIDEQEKKLGVTRKKTGAELFADSLNSLAVLALVGAGLYFYMRAKR